MLHLWEKDTNSQSVFGDPSEGRCVCNQSLYYMHFVSVFWCIWTQSEHTVYTVMHDCAIYSVSKWLLMSWTAEERGRVWFRASQGQTARPYLEGQQGSPAATLVQNHLQLAEHVHFISYHYAWTFCLALSLPLSLTPICAHTHTQRHICPIICAGAFIDIISNAPNYCYAWC